MGKNSIVFIFLVILVLLCNFAFSCTFGSYCDSGWYCDNCCNGGACSAVVCMETYCKVSGSGPWGCCGASSGCYPDANGKYVYSCTNNGNDCETVQHDGGGFIDCQYDGEYSLCQTLHCGGYGYAKETDIAGGCTDTKDNDNDGIKDDRDVDCCSVSSKNYYDNHDAKYCINKAQVNTGTFTDSNKAYLDTSGNVYVCHSSMVFQETWPSRITKTSYNNGNIKSMGGSNYICLNRGWVPFVDHDLDGEMCQYVGLWINEDCSSSATAKCANFKIDNSRTIVFNEMNNCCGDDAADYGKMASFFDSGLGKVRYFVCNKMGTTPYYYWAEFQQNQNNDQYSKVFCDYYGASKKAADESSFSSLIEEGSDGKGQCCGYKSSYTDFSNAYPESGAISTFPYMLPLTTEKEASDGEDAEFYDWQKYVFTLSPFSKTPTSDAYFWGGVNDFFMAIEQRYYGLSKKLWLPKGYYDLRTKDDESGQTTDYYIGSSKLSFTKSNCGVAYCDYISDFYNPSDALVEISVVSNVVGQADARAPHISLSWGYSSNLFCNQWSDGKNHWTSELDNEQVTTPAQSSCEQFDDDLTDPDQTWKYDSSYAAITNRCCGDDWLTDEGYFKYDASQTKPHLCYKSYVDMNAPESYTYLDSKPDAGIYFHQNNWLKFSTFLNNYNTAPFEHKTFGDIGNINTDSTEMTFAQKATGNSKISVVASYIGDFPSFKVCRTHMRTGSELSIDTNIDSTNYFVSGSGNNFFSLDMTDLSGNDGMFWDFYYDEYSSLCSDGICELSSLSNDFLEIVPSNFLGDAAASGNPPEQNFALYFYFSNIPIDVSKSKYLEFDFKWQTDISKGSFYDQKLTVCANYWNGCVDVLDYAIGSKDEGQVMTIQIPLADLGITDSLYELEFLIPLYLDADSSVSRKIGRQIKITGPTDYYCDGSTTLRTGTGWKSNSEIDTVKSPDFCKAISSSFDTTTSQSYGDTNGYKCCGDDSYYDDAEDRIVYENYKGDANNKCCAFGKVFNEGELINLPYYNMDYDTYYLQDVKNAGTVQTKFYFWDKSFICHDGKSKTDYDSGYINDKQSNYGDIVYCSDNKFCDYTATADSKSEGGPYYCSATSWDWKNLEFSNSEWNGFYKPSGSLGGGFLKSISSDRESYFYTSECCWKNQCWNGDVCVDSFDLPNEEIVHRNQDGSFTRTDINKNQLLGRTFSNTSGYNIPYSKSYRNQEDQYVCLYDSFTGSGEWTYVYYKEKFFDRADFEFASSLSYGFCFSDTQCWNGFSCVDSGTYVHNKDYYCENDNGVGTWKHKTKNLVNRMREYSDVNNKDVFDINCGQVNKMDNIYFQPILNIWWDEQYKKDPSDYYSNSLSKQFFGSENITSYCTYQTDGVKAIGVTINKSSDLRGIILSMLNVSTSLIDTSDTSSCYRSGVISNMVSSGFGYCTVDLKEDKYHSTLANTFGVYFNGDEGIVIVANKDTSFANKQEWYEGIINFFIDYFKGVFNLPGSYTSNIPDISFSDYFFYGHYDNLEIAGYQEWINNVSVTEKSVYDNEIYENSFDYYTQRVKDKAIYEFVVDFYGKDSDICTELSELKFNVDKVSWGSESADLLTYFEDYGGSCDFGVSAFFKNPSGYNKLFKLNENSDYIDYFGLFTRALRVERFN